MARAEAQLGTRLQWIAVDHHDTDNPHTHLTIRGDSYQLRAKHRSGLLKPGLGDGPPAGSAALRPVTEA